MSVRRSLHRTLAVVSALAIGLALAVVALPTAPAAAQGQITTSGPLTSIRTTPDLNCAVNHVDDSRGEFYSDTACGTFVSLDGVLYGPASIPAGSALGSTTPYTPVTQTTGGTGGVSDPHRIVTTVRLADTGVTLTQVDTYVAGQASFRTDIALVNEGSAARSGLVYRGADCYLANSDSGLGSTGPDGRVGCVNSTRAEEFIPITGGSTYIEAQYSEVWRAIGAQQPLPNTCRCTEMIDNGMALAWRVTIAGGSRTTVATATGFGTASTTAGQIEVASSSTPVSTDAQGRQTFNISRPSRADLTISVRPVPAPGCTITGVTINHAGLNHPATDPEGDGTWTATIPRDNLREGDITATVTDDCGNVSTSSVGRVTFYDPSGVVTDASTGTPVQGATVTLHNVPGWTAQSPGNTGPQTCETVDTRGPGGWTQPAPTGEGVVAAPASGTFTPDINPQATSDAGRYGWDVVTGCWYVTVTATGYAPLTSPVVGVPPEVTDLDLALTPTGGGPTTPPTPVDGVTRLQGSERMATAIAISQDMWLAGGADAVVVARQDNYPDSLAGGPLAVRVGGPLLLTTSSGLWADTAREIMRVLPSGGTVHLLGGVAALSEDVAHDLQDLGYRVVRHEGPTRFETAVAIARATDANPRVVLVADGNTFPDALTASGGAPARDATMVLTAGSTLPSSVADYLDANNGAVWITIGPAASAALPNADVAIVGADVYDTSRLAATTFWPDATGFAVASGENFPDGLAGSAHSARLGFPLLLSPRSGMTPEVLAHLAAGGPFSQAVLYGGEAALSATVASQAAAALG